MKKLEAKQIKLILIIFGVLISVSVIGFLTYKYWSPLGRKLKFNFGAKDGQITPTLTQGQNGNFAIPAQIIKNATTRFTMDVKSGEIESVTAKLKFKTGPKEIKLGIRGNEKDKFVYQPFYQKLLQECTWSKVEEVNKFLYQKVKKYDNIDQLVDNPPDYRQIASYNIHPSVLIQKLLAKGFDQKNAKAIDVKTGLRGTHTFVIRVDKAPFIFKLSKQDINMYAGEDKYLISISRDGKLIEEKSIADDGFVGIEKLKKEPQSVEFNLTDIEPGIYEINAKNESKGGDSVITQITTNQSKLVIKNNVFTLFDKPIIFYINTSPLTLTAVHKEYLQTVKLNDTIPLDLKKEGQKYVFDLESLVKDKKSNEFYKLETPKTDVSFSSTGYFAFAPEQYFDPEVIRATDLNTVASLDEIDYLLTSVPKARQEGDWLVSEVTFDPKDIKLDDTKKLYFSLEMPDLAKYSGELEIDSFTVDVNLKGVLSSVFNKPSVNNQSNTAPIENKNFFNQIADFFKNLFKKKPSTNPTITPIPSIRVTPTNNSITVVPTKIPSVSPSPTITPTSKPTPTPTIKPSPTTTGPTPTTGISKTIKIQVLNSGAPAGYAKKYTDLIKAAGYLSVTAGNATGVNTSNATISYPDKPNYKVDVAVIEDILKIEYKTINKVVNNASSDIVITIGAL